MAPLCRVAASMLALLLAGGAVNAQPEEWCRTRDRACLIEAAQTYIHTLASGDVDSLRLAPNVWRVELGSQNITGLSFGPHCPNADLSVACPDCAQP